MVLCPKSERSSSRAPGETDRCEDCGRVVRTRMDCTYPKHALPKDVERMRRQARRIRLEWEAKEDAR